MGKLYLVRHGQASLGSKRYDQLSPLGHQQAVRLGQYFREQGIAMDAVLHGTLQRQRTTWEAIAQGAGWQTQGQNHVQSEVRGALDEYHGSAIIRTVCPEPLEPPTTPEAVRHHFRLLRQGLLQWAAGSTQPEGMPTYAAFAQGVSDVLLEVRERHSGNVLMVSSGGPIATAVGLVLGAPTPAIIELNLRIRNTAVSELVFTPRHHSLLTFNTLAHLDGAQYEGWRTYA
jgi:broad specificity phosphatase PhoE